MWIEQPAPCLQCPLTTPGSASLSSIAGGIRRHATDKIISEEVGHLSIFIILNIIQNYLFVMHSLTFWARIFSNP